MWVSAILHVMKPLPWPILADHIDKRILGNDWRLVVFVQVGCMMLMAAQPPAPARAGMALPFRKQPITAHPATHPLNQSTQPCVQALISLVLLRLHPRPVAHTPSYEFSVSFGGVAFGLVAAVSRVHARYFEPFIQLGAVWAHGPLWLARRVVTGAQLANRTAALPQRVQPFAASLLPLAS